MSREKDCICLLTTSGEFLKQKSLLLHNLNELLYIKFREQYKNLKIVPYHQVNVSLPEVGIHSVCVWICHQDVKLMSYVININDYVTLLNQLVCSL